MTGQHVRAVVIGASAGAVSALSCILPRLGAGYPLPVLVVVHVPADDSGLTELFAQKCSISVCEPDDKAPIAPGQVYFAPPGYHMLVESDGCIALSTAEPELFSRPSINILFESAADHFRSDLVGVVLTGANEDGAEGAAAICAAGGTLLVEDPASAYARTMPAAALARCPDARSLSLQAIADVLVGLGTA